MKPDFREEVVSLLSAEIEEKDLPAGIGELIELPQREFGDYSFPCFVLAKKLGKSPADIAEELAGKIRPAGNISRVRAQGPYLNFFVDDRAITSATLRGVLEQKDGYGKGDEKKKVVVEYPSPNTNKPLHLGHVRNMLLGQSLSKILRFAGCEVFQVNLNNDRGVHICQAMLAYLKFGESREPDKKPDHFVGDFYVRFKKEQNKQFDREVREMLVRWEKGDEETRKLWKKNERLGA